MRESAYNIWMQKDDAAYVFNARSGSLLRLGHDDYQALRAFWTARSLYRQGARQECWLTWQRD